MTAAEFVQKWHNVIANGDVNVVLAAVAEARELGFTSEQNVGESKEFFADPEHGVERTCEWIIGGLLNIADNQAWYAMNSWVNVAGARLEEVGLLAPPPPPVCTFRWDTNAEDDGHTTWHHRCNLDVPHEGRHVCACGAQSEPPKKTPRNGVKLVCGCWHYGTVGSMAGRDTERCNNGHGVQVIEKANVDEPIDD